jgi:hypothetical protein
MHIFADQINQISLSNNNLRITLTQRGPDDSTIEVGTLIVPANQANNIVNGLVNSLKELGEKLKAAKEEQTEQ